MAASTFGREAVEFRLHVDFKKSFVLCGLCADWPHQRTHQGEISFQAAPHDPAGATSRMADEAAPHDSAGKAELSDEAPHKGEQSSPLRGDKHADSDEPAAASGCCSRKVLLRVAGGVCIVLLVLISWLAIVAGSYYKMAKCLHIDVDRINTTSLSEQQIYAYVETRTHVPSLFALDLGALRADLAVRSTGSHGTPPSPFEPAATLMLPAFSLQPGDHALKLIAALDLLGPDALGGFVNASTNAQPGHELQIRVRGSIRTSALFGIPINIPFDQRQTMASAPPPSKSNKPPPPPPPPPNPEAEAAARDKAAKHAAYVRHERLRECGHEEALTLSFAAQDIKHQFKVVTASADRLHVTGIFDALISSPAHVVIIPNLSTELCVLEADGTLRSIAQVSTRANTFLQPARFGTSDAIVDVVMAAALTPKPVAWNVTSRILDDDMPRLYVRGSTNAEVQAGASSKDKPAGYNTASSSSALQRVLQAVSYPISKDLLEGNPQTRRLARFAACSWQALNKGDSKVPWTAGLACASELSANNSSEIVPKLIDGITDLTNGLPTMPDMPSLPGMGDGKAFPSLPTGKDDVASWMPDLPWSQPSSAPTAGTTAPTAQPVSTSGRARSTPSAPTRSLPSAPSPSPAPTAIKRDRGSALDSLAQLKFR
jgi:hypothetical protein